MNILSVEHLSIGFGGLKAVDDLSFEVEAGSIYGLIGPNGAGKTTVFNCISRFYDADSGKILFRKSPEAVIDLNHYKVHQVIGQGLARTFQNIELFKHMTVSDNLMVGLHSKTPGGFVGAAFFMPWIRREEKAKRQEVKAMLQYLGLEAIEHQAASAQPYGVQKLLELGRALITRPKLIILDEPAAGMNDSETEALSQLLKRVKQDFGVTILLVEHDMNLVMGICDRLCVINFGRKIAEGTPQEIQASPAVQEAYLGKEEPQHA